MTEHRSSPIDQAPPAVVTWAAGWPSAVQYAAWRSGAGAWTVTLYDVLEFRMFPMPGIGNILNSSTSYKVTVQAPAPLLHAAY